jgi:hypothetical protein
MRPAIQRELMGGEEVGESAADDRNNRRTGCGDDAVGSEIGRGSTFGREFHCDVARGKTNAGRGNAHQHVDGRQQVKVPRLHPFKTGKSPGERTEQKERCGDTQHGLVAEPVDERAPQTESREVAELASDSESQDGRHRVVEAFQKVDREERRCQIDGKVPRSQKQNQPAKIRVREWLQQQR